MPNHMLPSRGRPVGFRSGFVGSRFDRFPSLADETLEFAYRDALEIHDDVGSLAPHEPDEGLWVGFEKEFLSLFGKMQIEAVRPHHGEDAFLGAETGPPEVIDFAHAIQRERDLSNVRGG